MRRLADCRYAGQGYEVRFDVPAGAVDDAWVEELAEALPRRARGGVRAALRRRHRDHQHPRRRHRPRRRAAAGASSSRATATRRAARDAWSARSCSRSTARCSAARRRSTSASGCAPATALDGPGDRRAVRLDDRRSRPGLTAEIDRHGNIVIDCTTRAAARRDAAPALATPILMRVIGGAFAVDRQGDGRRPLPHVLLVDHPRVRGPRRRASSTATATSWPSRTPRRCSWARCRRS